MKTIDKLLEQVKALPIDSSELLLTDDCIMNDDIVDDNITAIENNSKSRKGGRYERAANHKNLRRKVIDSMGTNIHTLTNIASVLSKLYKLNVQINNSDRAYTSYDDDLGITINIPIILKDNEYIRLMYRGYIDHEAAHARFSDFKALYRLNELASEHGYAQHNVMGIANILEGVFVENKLSKYYSGCKENFSKLAKLLFLDMSATLKDIDNFKQLSKSPMVYLLNYILLKVRGFYVPELLANADIIKQVIPKDLLDRIDPLLDKHVDCMSTGDNVDLALAIYKEIVDYTDKPKQDKHSQDDSSKDNSSKDDSSKDDSSQDKSSQDDSSQDNLFDSRNLDKFLNSSASEKLSDHTNALFDSGILLSAALETLGKAVELGDNKKFTRSSISDMGKSAVASNIISWAAHKYEHYHSENTVQRLIDYEGDIYKSAIFDEFCIENLSYDSLVEASSITGLLLSRLKALLQAQDLRKTGIGYRGRLNTSKLHRVAFNDSKVFTINRQDPSVNTEIVLCLDCSGSMSVGSKQELSSQVTFSVMKSLRTIKGVKSSVVAFNNNPKIILRPTDVLTTKLNIAPTGGTNIGNAIITAHHLFSKDELSRKIIVVVSDGCCEAAPVTRAIADAYKKDGVEFIGLGIMDSSIEAILHEEEYVVVNDLKKFAPELIGLLQKKLLDRSQAA